MPITLQFEEAQCKIGLWKNTEYLLCVTTNQNIFIA